VEDFDGGALPDDVPRLVVPDDEFLDDGGDEASLIVNSDDTADDVLNVSNDFVLFYPLLLLRSMRHFIAKCDV